jgi:hypothetical protein
MRIEFAETDASTQLLHRRLALVFFLLRYRTSSWLSRTATGGLFDRLAELGIPGLAFVNNSG